MIDDSSISDIIKSWKSSSQSKLKHDQETMKSTVMTQFQKISKEESVSQCVLEVYSVVIFNKNSTLLSELSSYPNLEASLLSYLFDHLKNFYDETTLIGEDGFNLMTYFDYLLNAYDERYLFWCSYPQISYDIIEEADTYYFTLIQFDASKYHHNLYFGQKLHPFIKALNYAWISNYKESSYDNAFRKAASNTNDLLNGIWDHINILSSLKYEGSHNNGSILFIEGHDPTIKLQLEETVPLSHYRQIRKLLQMSLSEHYLLVDTNYKAIGFGTLPSGTAVYRVDFLDHLSWKLYYGDEEFLSCYNLLPQLPSIGNNLNKLKQQLALTFSKSNYNEASLIQIIEEAKLQRKGTMIVVTENAQEEAHRLHTSSIKIKPTPFSQKQIRLITSIDGAIIMGTNGYAYAIGSILDGFAIDNGDPSRGARYNSALRYINTQRKAGIPCLIAVISEDRYIDILTTVED